MTLLARLRRFGRATGGLAALEFALIAPMMVFVLFGSVELIDALGANRRAQNATSSIADVVARDTEVSTDEINGLWAAVDVLMFPDSGDGMAVCVASVSIDDRGRSSVVWNRTDGGFGGCPSTAGSNLPAAMRRPNTSVIIAETRYRYQPPLGFLYEGNFDMRHTVYRRSRLVDPIPCTWSGCSTQ